MTDRTSNAQHSRRRFMTMAVGTGLGAWLMQSARAGDEVKAGTGLNVFERRGRAFGTETALTVLHADGEAARAALNEAMAEIQKVEALFTLYKEGSPVVRLNRTGVLENPDPLHTELFKTARAFAEKTGGAFDITVQPLWALYERCLESEKRLPAHSEITAARAAVDYQAVEIADSKIRLTRPGMSVTLNGIAQGFATDRALAALRRHGIQHALVNAGEWAALGRKEKGADWVAGIANPARPDALIAALNLRDRCFATSGDYETTFSPDRRNNHIFDPKTGASPLELSSVSILARSATDADALSTAVFVLGVEKGLQLIETQPDCEAFLVRKDGSTVKTKGFPAV